MEPVELVDVQQPIFTEKEWAVTGTKLQRKHHIVNSLYLDPAILEKTIFERFERYKTIEREEVRYESFLMEDAEYCVVAFGIASRVSKNAVMAARKEGIKVGLIRPITLWPFPKKALEEAANRVKGFVSVELSMGQMIEDIKLSIGCRRPVLPRNRSGGMIMSPEEVLASIRALQGGASK